MTARTGPAGVTREARPSRTVQAWIEPIADDPEALSALEVARRALPASLRLRSLRRMRLMEITGPLKEGWDVGERLHESTQFYNPHKERVFLRQSTADLTPGSAEERLVLIRERGGERRAAAERWWRHVTGDPVQVREATVWLVTPESAETATALLGELVELRDRHHGLLCNPHSQDRELASATVPVPWLDQARPERARKGRR